MRDYGWVIETIREKVVDQDDHERRMRVVVDALWEQLSDKGVSWVGVYLKVPDQNEMVLGPSRDKPACSPIGLQGVCGQSFLNNAPMVIHDVAELGENYIACDPRDRSEIVVPVYSHTGRIIGVLDLDSYEIAAFNDEDVSGLQAVLQAAGLAPVPP